ncbi:phage baseplate assembly protein V [Sanguibacter sp. A247]|uniref:phage baseplate assembly protein V n=1 Tax=unclassified Sanguibacter TaxID=2645534 RepID=UPI003FD89CE9
MNAGAQAVALSPHVEIAGEPLPIGLDGTLVALRIVTALRTTGWARLEFAASTTKVLDSRGVHGAAVGDRLRVSGRPTDGTRIVPIFTGSITRIETVRGERGGTRLVVTAQDETAKLTTESAQTFLKQTYDDMMSSLAESAHITVTSSGLPNDAVPYLLKAGSALRFIDDIAKRCGSDWVLHGTTLHLWPAGAPRPGVDTVSLPVAELVHCEVAQQSGGPTKAIVTAWDAAQSTALSSEAARPTKHGINVTERVVLDTSSSPLTAAEASTLARSHLAGNGPVSARVRAPRLVAVSPGATLTVADTWWPDDATYVRDVTVTWDRTGFATEILSGSRAETRLADLGGRGADRGSAAYTHDGVVVGVVTAHGRGGDNGPLGHVRVAFPFLGSTITSDWARVAAAGAGGGRGLLVIPEVNDEVLVAFEGSDVRRPVVVAGLYSEKNKAPWKDTTENGEVQHRALTSRTGHVIELSDDKDKAKQHVLLALAGGQRRLRLGGDKVDLTVPDGTPVTISSGTTRIHLDDQGAVTIEGSTITVKAKQRLALDAPEISIKAQSKLALEGAEVAVKGQAKTSVEAGGLTQIKGGMVQLN